jgi:hypothetical protein
MKFITLFPLSLYFIHFAQQIHSYNIFCIVNGETEEEQGKISRKQHHGQILTQYLLGIIIQPYS